MQNFLLLRPSIFFAFCRNSEAQLEGIANEIPGVTIIVLIPIASPSYGGQSQFSKWLFLPTHTFKIIHKEQYYRTTKLPLYIQSQHTSTVSNSCDIMQKSLARHQLFIFYIIYLYSKFIHVSSMCLMTSIRLFYSNHCQLLAKSNKYHRRATKALGYIFVNIFSLIMQMEAASHSPG